MGKGLQILRSRCKFCQRIERTPNELERMRAQVTKARCTSLRAALLVFGRCGKKGEYFFARARTFSPQKNSTAAGLCTSFFLADFVLFACLFWWPAGPTVVLITRTT